jgi:transcriptional regulator with XRE-family HTH domain
VDEGAKTKRARELPLPVTPGEWLRAFRHRSPDQDETSSLERLSFAVGVSTKTIRRWETGRSFPDQNDLRNLARYFHLTPLQMTFLGRAFSNMPFGPERASPQVLQEQVSPLLAREMPTYLLDRLFYVRAWNSFTGLVEPESDPQALHPHFIGRLLTFPEARESAVDYEALIDNLIRVMWLGTGRGCGSASYVQMLHELAEIPGFRERWCSLVNDDDRSQWPGTPPTFALRDGGKFSLFSSKIEFPPTFYLVQLIPCNDAAWNKVNILRESGPPEVYFQWVLH